MPPDDDLSLQFRRRYWQVVRELDTERLRQWERWQLTLPQLRVLFHVRRSPGITMGELARALGVTASTTSGLVAKLADRGLLRRCVAADRRQTQLELTGDAEQVVSEVADGWRPFLLDVSEALGDDLAGVTTALGRLADAAAAVRQRECPAVYASAGTPPVFGVGPPQPG